MRGSLLTPQRDDLFRDKELDGLLLPVVHIAIQLVRVHTWRRTGVTAGRAALAAAYAPPRDLPLPRSL